MEFYSLINIKNEKEIAEVVEFDDGQVVVKWIGKVNGLIIHKNLQEFKDVSLNKSRILLYQGLVEGDNDEN